MTTIIRSQPRLDSVFTESVKQKIAEETVLLKNAKQCHDRLKNKSTLYARAVGRLILVHSAALDVYVQALREWETDVATLPTPFPQDRNAGVRAAEKADEVF